MLIPFGKKREKTAKRDTVDFQDGYPVNKNGMKLPYIDSEGNLNISTDATIFAFWKTKSNPNAFGLRDILKYVEASEEVWSKYPNLKGPECRDCIHAKRARGSKTGAQIICDIGFRKERFPACSSICRRKQLEMQRDNIKEIQDVKSRESKKFAGKKLGKIALPKLKKDKSSKVSRFTPKAPRKPLPKIGGKNESIRKSE